MQPVTHVLIHAAKLSERRSLPFGFRWISQRILLCVMNGIFCCWHLLYRKSFTFSAFSLKLSLLAMMLLMIISLVSFFMSLVKFRISSAIFCSVSEVRREFVPTCSIARVGIEIHYRNCMVFHGLYSGSIKIIFIYFVFIFQFFS